MNKRYTYSVTCPVSYYNGTRWTMGWSNGRILTSATDGTTNISYAYDLGGMRTGKTVGTVSSIYFYASGKLLREIRYNSADQTTDILDFFYAYDGTPYAMKYNGTVYYFVTNLQGDVVMILNANGSLAGGYVYDPYGKVLTATGTIANINPLRYRGYYYDTETGFYYLQNRYYDPEIGRFINADGYASTGQGVIGHNMFAYCNNNPVNYKDLSGDFAISAVTIGTVALKAVIGAGAGIGVGYVASAIAGESYTTTDIFVDGLCGALGTGNSVASAIGISVDVVYSAGKAYRNNESVGTIFLEAAEPVLSYALTPSKAPIWKKTTQLSDDATDIFDIAFGTLNDLSLSVTSRVYSDSSKSTTTISSAERKKLTFKETQLDPPKNTSSMTYAEYKKLTFMESRLV